MSAMGVLSGLVLLTMSFVDHDPQQTTRKIKLPTASVAEVAARAG
jgi:hypothetical protein